MKGWWIPWTFPVFLLGVVVLFALLGAYAAFVAVPVCLVALPWLWRVANPSDDPDADVNYWRIQAPWRP